MQVLQVFAADVLLHSERQARPFASVKLLVTNEEDRSEVGIFSTAKVDRTCFRFHQSMCIALRSVHAHSYLHKFCFQVFGVANDKLTKIGSAVVRSSNLESKIAQTVDICDSKGEPTASLMLSLLYSPAPVDAPASVPAGRTKAKAPVPAAQDGKEYTFLLSRKIRRPDSSSVANNKDVERRLARDAKPYQHRPNKPTPRPSSAPRPAKRAESPAKVRDTVMSVGYVKNAWPDPHAFELDKQMYKLKVATEQKVRLLKQLAEQSKAKAKAKPPKPVPMAATLTQRPQSASIDSRRLSTALKEREDEVRDLRAQLSRLQVESTALSPVQRPSTSPMRSPERYSALAERLIDSYEVRTRRVTDSTDKARRSEKRSSSAAKSRPASASRPRTPSARNVRAPSPAVVRPPAKTALSSSAASFSAAAHVPTFLRAHSGHPTAAPTPAPASGRRQHRPASDKKTTKRQSAEVPTARAASKSGLAAAVGVSAASPEVRSYLSDSSSEGHAPLSSSLLVDELADLIAARANGQQRPVQVTTAPPPTAPTVLAHSSGLFPEQLLSNTRRYEYSIGGKVAATAAVPTARTVAVQHQFEKNRLFSASPTPALAPSESPDLLAMQRRAAPNGNTTQEDAASSADEVDLSEAETVPAMVAAAPAPAATEAYAHRDQRKRTSAAERVQQQFEKNRKFQDGTPSTARGPSPQPAPAQKGPLQAYASDEDDSDGSAELHRLLLTAASRKSIVPPAAPAVAAAAARLAPANHARASLDSGDLLSSDEDRRAFRRFLSEEEDAEGDADSADSPLRL